MYLKFNSAFLKVIHKRSKNKFSIISAHCCCVRCVDLDHLGESELQWLKKTVCRMALDFPSILISLIWKTWPLNVDGVNKKMLHVQNIKFSYKLEMRTNNRKSKKGDSNKILKDKGDGFYVTPSLIPWKIMWTSLLKLLAEDFIFSRLNLIAQTWEHFWKRHCLIPSIEKWFSMAASTSVFNSTLK